MKKAEHISSTSSQLQNYGTQFFVQSQTNQSGNENPFFRVPLIQTKLTIGEPDDAYEKEADMVADQVVQRLMEPAIQTKASPGISVFDSSIQTKCDSCGEEENEEKPNEESGEQVLRLKVDERPSLNRGRSLPDGPLIGVQKKPIFESDADPVQLKCATCENQTLAAPQVVGPRDDVGNNGHLQRYCRECEEGEKVYLKSSRLLQRSMVIDNAPTVDGSRDSIVAFAKTKIGKIEAKNDAGDGKRVGSDDLLEIFQLAAPGVWNDNDIENIGGQIPSWCGIFTVWAHKKAGKDIGTWQMGKGVSAFGTLTQTTNPQPGDIGYIHIPYQHHCIIEKIEGDVIYSIDGNSGTYSEVKENKKPRSVYDGFFTAFASEGGINVRRKGGQGIAQAKSEPGETRFSSIESKLSSKSGHGSVLPSDIQGKMEGAFGNDFSQVRIHTDSEAVQMSKDLNAQAFTHGNDIYFNSGKFNTADSSGQQLLAHELTHTVQQNGGISKKSTPDIQRDPATEEQKQAIRDAIMRQGVAIADEDIQAIHDEYPGGVSAYRQLVIVQVSGNSYSSISRVSAVRLGPLWQGPVQVELFVFQVGKGRAILVSSIGGASIMLDAGAGGAVRSNSAAARTLATHLNAVTMAGLAAPPSTIKLSHADADHFNALSSVLNLPQMGSAVVEITRQQLSQAMAQGNWTTMNVQMAPGQSIVQLNVTGAGLDVRRSIIGNMEVTEFRSAAEHNRPTTPTTPGETRFNKNNTSPVTIVRDIVTNTTYVFTADAQGRLLNDVVNLVGEDAFRRIAGGGQRNLAGVEFPHHGGAVEKGPSVTGMVRFLRIMFEASNGTVNFFTQTSTNFSGSGSAAIRYLDTAEIAVERVTDNPTGRPGVRNIRGRRNTTITLNTNQIASVVALGNTNSSRVMEAYQVRDRMLTVSENLQVMRGAFQMVPGDAERLATSLGNARTEVQTNLTSIHTSLDRFWRELGNAAQASGMRASANTAQLQTEVSNLGRTTGNINIAGIENALEQIRAETSLMGRIFVNALSMQQALRFRNLAEMNRLKAEQRQLVNELLRGARAQLGQAEFHSQIRAAWQSTRSGWNQNYIRRISARMGMSEAQSRQVLFRSQLGMNLTRQIQLNDLARRAQEGSLPRGPGGAPPMRTRAGAGIMAGIELLRIGLELYESYEAAEEAATQRERERRIQGLREVYWWEHMGVRPVIKLVDDGDIVEITTENAYNVIEEKTPEDQRPEYDRVVVADVSDEDLQTVVGQFYLRFVSISDWIEEMGNPNVNDRRTVRSGNSWFLKGSDGWRIKLWIPEEEEYQLVHKAVIQQPLNDLMTHLEASQEEELSDLVEEHAAEGTFTIADTAWFGVDRNAFVYNSSGGAHELDFEDYQPEFVKLGREQFAYRIRGDMTLVRAANAQTYRSVSRHYWIQSGGLYADSRGTHREYFVIANTRGLAYVPTSKLRQKTAPTPPVQQKPEPGTARKSAGDLEPVLRQESDRGSELSQDTKQSIGTALNADFGSVKIHTDSHAIDLNRRLNSQAFTKGRDVYFNQNKYRPQTVEGKHLLAHELTHVVQQSNSGNNSILQRHPVAPTPVVRLNQVTLLGDGTPAHPGQTLLEFERYSRQQGDWFTEPTLTAIDRTNLWGLLRRLNEGDHVMAGTGDLRLAELVAVTSGDWVHLAKFGHGRYAETDTVRISSTSPYTITQRINLGETLAGLEGIIPPEVLKLTVSEAQLNDIEANRMLLLLLRLYWLFFSPHLQQTYTPAAGARGPEVQKILDLLNGVGFFPFLSLIGNVRNIHRFSVPMLQRLVTNFTDHSHTKPLHLILHSGHDERAFQQAAHLFENLVLNSPNLVLMLEGAETLAGLTARIPTIASAYGRDDGTGNFRIAQVMIAGHGSARSVQLAGTGSPSVHEGKIKYGNPAAESLNLDTNAVATQNLLDTLIQNMDPATARIVYAGCLVGANAVPASVPPADIASHITGTPSLGTFTEQRGTALGRPVAVESARASVGLSAATSLMDVSGNLHIEYNFDPTAFGDALTYIATGHEPEGVMRAAVEVAALNSPLVAANQLRTRLGLANTHDWWDECTIAFVQTALDGVPAGGPADLGRLNILANIAETFFLARFGTSFSINVNSFVRVVNPHAISGSVYPRIVATPTMTSPDDRAQLGRLTIEQAWMNFGGVRANELIGFLDATAGLTTDRIRIRLNPAVLSPFSASLFPPAAGVTPGRIRLALAWLVMDNSNSDVVAFLDNEVVNPATSPELSAAVRAQLGGLVETEVLEKLGRLTASTSISSGGSTISVPNANAEITGDLVNDVRIERETYQATVLPFALNVRRGPSMAHPPFAWLHKGDVVQVAGFVHRWAAIDMNGRLGFVFGDQITPP